MPDVTVICHACRRSAEYESVVGRGDECDGCGADLRVCLNCAFYDASAYNECGEPSAERVLEKDKGNFCDFFRAADGRAHGAASAGGNNSVNSELDELFGKK